MHDVRDSGVQPNTESTKPVQVAIDERRPEKPVRRTGEIVVAVVGLVLSGLFLGGFTAVVNGVDEQAFLAEVYPALKSAGIVVAEDEAYRAARTLAGWFGFTLLAVVATNAVGIFLARRLPRRRVAGWWFLAAGLLCLIGSQLILYPVAFLFFVAAALFAVRQIPPPEPMAESMPESMSESRGAPA